MPLPTLFRLPTYPHPPNHPMQLPALLPPSHTRTYATANLLASHIPKFTRMPLPTPLPPSYIHTYATAILASFIYATTSLLASSFTYSLLHIFTHMPLPASLPPSHMPLPASLPPPSHIYTYMPLPASLPPPSHNQPPCHLLHIFIHMPLPASLPPPSFTYSHICHCQPPCPSFLHIFTHMPLPASLPPPCLSPWVHINAIYF